MESGRVGELRRAVCRSAICRIQAQPHPGGLRDQLDPEPISQFREHFLCSDAPDHIGGFGFSPVLEIAG